MSELLSQSAYAKLRGVTRQAVGKAIRVGRLSASVVAVDGRVHPMIDRELADQEWDAKTDPTQVREEHRRATRAGQERLFETGEPPEPGPGHVAEPTAPRMDDSPSPATAGSGAREEYTNARARRETVMAQMAELELQERMSGTVPAERVRRDWIKAARVVRDSILQLPSKLSSRLAAASDAREVRILLERALEDALRDLAENGAERAA